MSENNQEVYFEFETDEIKKENITSKSLSVALVAIVCLIVLILAVRSFNSTKEVETTTAPPSTTTTATGVSFVEGTPNVFYYEQLTDNQKEIYNKAKKALESGETNFSYTGKKSDLDDAEKAVYAFVDDYPEYFYLQTGYEASKKGVSINVSIKTWDFYSTRNARQLQKDFDSKVEEIVAAGKQIGGDYEKIKYVYDYIKNNCSYDFDVASKNQDKLSKTEQMAHTAYGALVNGKAVCDGYAKAFQLILNKIGYECAIVSGEAEGGRHAWNVIKVGKDYYYCDVTWDDQEKEGKNYKCYDYFCITSAEIEKDHFADSEWKTPNATAKALNFYTRNRYEAEIYSDATIKALVDRQMVSGIYIKFSNKSAYNTAITDIEKITNYVMTSKELNSCNYSKNDNLNTIVIFK